MFAKVLLSILMVQAVCVAVASSTKRDEAEKIKSSLIKGFQCQACKRQIPESQAASWVATKVKQFQEREARYWNETVEWEKKVKSGRYTARMNSRQGNKRDNSTGPATDTLPITPVPSISAECAHDPPAPRGYMKFHGFGHYKLYINGEKWSKAQEICQDDGGDLVVINSDGESQVLKTLMKHHPKYFGVSWNEFALIGAQKIGDEFYTVFGDRVRDTGFNRWAPGEPNKYDNEEFCLSLTRNAEYNDIDCHNKYAFICEHFNRDLKSTMFHT